MAKIRVYELAKNLGLGTKELMKELQALGTEVKSHMSGLDEETANLVLETLKEKKEEKKKLSVNEGITVAKLAEKMGIKPNELIKKLMKQNIFASLNQSLNKNAIQINDNNKWIPIN